ncbi:unnamed protein product [Tenebrio molitor]|nr:unnamed protein product [Tenebrio molitor]
MNLGDIRENGRSIRTPLENPKDAPRAAYLSRSNKRGCNPIRFFGIRLRSHNTHCNRSHGTAGRRGRSRLLLGGSFAIAAALWRVRHQVLHLYLFAVYRKRTKPNEPLDLIVAFGAGTVT